MSNIVYLHLSPGADLPEVSSLEPFRVVVIVEAEVSSSWQSAVSEWLVRSGCLYSLAWGENSISWDNSVDMANIEQFDFKEIPENKFVMTTWHEDETLSEVFWFCKNNAFHPTVELKHTMLLHIAVHPREQEIVGTYAES